MNAVELNITQLAAYTEVHTSKSVEFRRAHVLAENAGYVTAVQRKEDSQSQAAEGRCSTATAHRLHGD